MAEQEAFGVTVKIGLAPQKFEAWSGKGGAMVVTVKEKKYQVGMGKKVVTRIWTAGISVLSIYQDSSCTYV